MLPFNQGMEKFCFNVILFNVISKYNFFYTVWLAHLDVDNVSGTVLLS